MEKALVPWAVEKALVPWAVEKALVPWAVEKTLVPWAVVKALALVASSQRGGWRRDTCICNRRVKDR